MRSTTAILAGLLCAAPLLAQAQMAAAPAQVPAGVLSLNAQASDEIPADIVHITVFHEEQAADPARLTAALSGYTDAALKQTRGQSAVAVSTGGFSVSQATDRDGKPIGWRGRSELLLESGDVEAASQLAGKLAPGMQVGDVSFSLSQQARQTAEARLVDSAIAGFRQQAQAAARSFGYSGYTIRDVSLERGGAAPRPMMRMMAAAPMSAPVPLAAGKTTVTVTVSGSVQMTR